MIIRTAAVLGAGAVGAYFIHGLQDVPDIDFCLIAEGDRAERLKKDGVCINGKVCRPAVRTPEEAAGTDLILLAVKYSGLADAVDEIARAAGPDTIVMSLLNGVDSEEILSARIGEERVLHAFMRIASRREGGQITFDPDVTAGVFYGEKDGNNATPRMAAVTALFEKAGLSHHPSTDIVREQWIKFKSNVCYNLPQALLGVGYGAYFASDHVEALRAALEEEVLMTAKAEGIELEPGGDAVMLYPAASRYSTLQDLDAGRHTEVDMFLGVMMKKAKEHGLRVPVSETVYHIIKALEEKNDGVFDFG